MFSAHREYRDKINEMGEAPVLRHGDIKLSQSGVILLYLAQRSGKFLPRGEDAQLEALRWIIFDNQQVGGALGPYRFLRNRADSALAIFDKRLSRGPYILGAEPTIADISLTSYLYYPSQEFGLKAADAVKRMRGRLATVRGLLEEFYGSERFGRPWPEAVQYELRLLPGLDVNKEVVVLLFGRLALPIQIGRIVRRHLDARPARKSGVLLGAAAPQHQILHAIHLE